MSQFSENFEVPGLNKVRNLLRRERISFSESTETLNGETSCTVFSVKDSFNKIVPFLRLRVGNARLTELRDELTGTKEEQDRQKFIAAKLIEDRKGKELKHSIREFRSNFDPILVVPCLIDDEIKFNIAEGNRRGAVFMDLYSESKTPDYTGPDFDIKLEIWFPSETCDNFTTLSWWLEARKHSAGTETKPHNTIQKAQHLWDRLVESDLKEVTIDELPDPMDMSENAIKERARISTLVRTKLGIHYKESRNTLHLLQIHKVLVQPVLKLISKKHDIPMSELMDKVGLELLAVIVGNAKLRDMVLNTKSLTIEEMVRGFLGTPIKSASGKVSYTERKFSIISLRGPVQEVFSMCNDTELHSCVEYFKKHGDLGLDSHLAEMRGIPVKRTPKLAPEVDDVLLGTDEICSFFAGLRKDSQKNLIDQLSAIHYGVPAA